MDEDKEDNPFSSYGSVGLTPFVLVVGLVVMLYEDKGVKPMDAHVCVGLDPLVLVVSPREAIALS